MEDSAAAVRDRAKRAQYEKSDLLGYAFVPLSTETFGRIGKPLRKLSVGLCTGNCVLYKRSLYALAHVSGNAFCAGADIPTSEIN